ncbi:MAG: type II toxin-antitoxin system RelE/ParE family toxin [Roseiarcus sp.]
MARVRYAKRAREDLHDIWLHVARRGSEAVADKVIDRIEERCRQLKDHPQLGPARPEIGAGARALVVERWLALYRLAPDGVQIVRVVDGARDLGEIEWTTE